MVTQQIAIGVILIFIGSILLIDLWANGKSFSESKRNTYTALGWILFAVGLLIVSPLIYKGVQEEIKYNKSLK
jgi:hypothetical protein